MTIAIDKIELTSTQRQRLMRLAVFLETRVPDEHFNMEAFTHIGGDLRDKIDPHYDLDDHVGGEARKFLVEALKPHDRAEGHHFCGTSACAVGWAAVIHPTLSRKVEYTALAQKLYGDWFHINSEPWEFLFGGSWDIIDNTPEGAAKRIRFLLEHEGIPAGFSEPESILVEPDFTEAAVALGVLD